MNRFKQDLNRDKKKDCIWWRIMYRLRVYKAQLQYISQIV